MTYQQKTTIYTKACGKVLIAGGYGVLQKNNIGLSLALENYFYCVLQHSHKGSKTSVHLNSPQIKKSYQYKYNSETHFLQEKNDQQNVFVENAIFFSLKHFKLLQDLGQLKLTLIFDKGFISDKSIETNDQKFPIYAQNYSKTGLGSSACVVVSIVSSICAMMGHKQNRNMINVISQVANLSAQKKIGSNFDISTAIYGTHLYKNILPQMAYKYIQQQDFSYLLSIDAQIKQLKNINSVFRDESIAFMIDVSKGANTRVMVSNFLKNLRAQDQKIQKEFFQQSKTITKDLYHILQTVSQNSRKTIFQLKQVNKRHRELQQKFSRITKTAVEPEQLTPFLNELTQNQNIWYVICPGSGGFDALLLVGSNKQSKDYYAQAIQAAKTKHQKSLGQQVKFYLKEVKIKWSSLRQVQQIQIQEIRSFLQKNSLKTI